MSSFVKDFDCKNRDHVMWLKEMGQVMTKVSGGEKVDVISYMNNNPIQSNPTITKVMDLAEIHFMLAMKYANAVLNSDAFVPTDKV